MLQFQLRQFDIARSIPGSEPTSTNYPQNCSLAPILQESMKNKEVRSTYVMKDRANFFKRGCKPKYCVSNFRQCKERNGVAVFLKTKIF
jgi:hypothetical protein